MDRFSRRIREWCQAVSDGRMTRDEAVAKIANFNKPRRGSMQSGSKESGKAAACPGLNTAVGVACQLRPHSHSIFQLLRGQSVTSCEGVGR